MAPKDVIFNGAKFVPNNYSAILSKAEAPSELHFIQDFLANSDIGYALTQLMQSLELKCWSSGEVEYMMLVVLKGPQVLSFQQGRMSIS